MEIIIKKEERQMIYNSDTRIVTFFTPIKFKRNK